MGSQEVFVCKNKQKKRKCKTFGSIFSEKAKMLTTQFVKSSACITYLANGDERLAYQKMTVVRHMTIIV